MRLADLFQMHRLCKRILHAVVWRLPQHAVPYLIDRQGHFRCNSSHPSQESEMSQTAHIAGFRAASRGCRPGLCLHCQQRLRFVHR